MKFPFLSPTAGYKFTTRPPRNPVKFCVHDEAELAKCNDLETAARAYGVDAGIGVGCYLGDAPHYCFPELYFGNADVIALDGGDVYQVKK